MTDTSNAELEARAQQIRYFVSHHRGWFLALGIVLVLVGMAAIAFPFLSTLATKIALGWLILFSGVVNIVHAFGTRGWRAFALNFLIGLLFLAAGAYLVFLPLGGIISLTILLAALFIVEGYLEIMMAIRLQREPGWLWVLFSGILAIAAGVLIGLQLPSSATWAIGLLTGINILASGLSFVFLALLGSRAHAREQPRSA